MPDEWTGPRDERDMPITPIMSGLDDETAEAVQNALDRGYVDPVDHD